MNLPTPFPQPVSKPDTFLLWAFEFDEGLLGGSDIVQNWANDDSFPDNSYSILDIYDYLVENYELSEDDWLLTYALLGRYAVETAAWKKSVEESKRKDLYNVLYPGVTFPE